MNNEQCRLHKCVGGVCFGFQAAKAEAFLYISDFFISCEAVPLYPLVGADCARGLNGMY
jgi:hypothetical protein